MAKVDSQRAYLNKSLIEAAAAISLTRVRIALDAGACPNFTDQAQCGWTALHFACYFSLAERWAESICDILLSKGANPDLLSSDGASPLLTAASVGSLGAVKLLVRKSARIDLADKNGMTALMGAADRGDSEIVSELLGAGADAALRDGQGRSAIDFAMGKKLFHIVALIEAQSLAQCIPASAPRMACR